MTDPRSELLDETTLRRALRLEADERPPRFDPAAIGTAAGLRRRVALVSGLAALGVSAVGVVVVWSAVAIVLQTVFVNAFDGALGIIAVLAVPASAIGALVQQPVIPLSLLAALAIATAHELRQRKELAHANAS